MFLYRLIVIMFSLWKIMCWLGFKYTMEAKASRRLICMWQNPGLVPLKWQCHEIFDLQFCSSFDPTWATDQGVKLLMISVPISLSYLSFKFEKSDFPGYQTPERLNHWGIRPWGPVSDFMESDVRVFRPRGRLTFRASDPGRLTRRGISSSSCFCWVFYCPGSDTPGSQIFELNYNSTNS